MPKQKLKLPRGPQGRLPSSSTDPNRGNRIPGGGGWGRSRATVKRLRMYARPAYERDRNGRIQHDRGDLTSSVVKEPGAGRIPPNRRWFGNTRTIDQESLQTFRESISGAERDPYTIVLRQRHLPWTLIKEGMEARDVERFEHAAGRANLRSHALAEGSEMTRGVRFKSSQALLRLEPFAETFHQRRWRKRPRIAFDSIEELAESVRDTATTAAAAAGAAQATTAEPGAGSEEPRPEAGPDTLRSRSLPPVPGAERSTAGSLKKLAPEQVPERSIDALGKTAYTKGQSHRIWSELYKVIDASDVVLFVLDARDPLGTRIPLIENMLRKEHAHKHLAFVLNKCDLVPKQVTAVWLRLLSREYPTVVFRANDCKRAFGRGALLQLLRQFARLHRKDRQSITCGLVGYPNVGKSSIINALRKEKVVRAAPIPGETKVWQYVTLFRRVYLVDCPGVVHARLAGHMDVSDMVLRGVVRIESLRDDAERHIPRLLERVNRHHLEAVYRVSLDGCDADGFLDAIARARGKLLPGGEPDRNATAKLLIHDFILGRLQWYVAPPAMPSSVAKANAVLSLDGSARASVIGTNAVEVSSAGDDRNSQMQRHTGSNAGVSSPGSEALDMDERRAHSGSAATRPLVDGADLLLHDLLAEQSFDEDDEAPEALSVFTTTNTSRDTSAGTQFTPDAADSTAGTSSPVRVSETAERSIRKARKQSTSTRSKRRAGRLSKRLRRLAEWNTEPVLQANLQRTLQKTEPRVH